MPLSALEIPPPKNWQDFESLTLSSFKIRWQNPDLVKNGRQGQPQAGVDIFGNDFWGKPVGVQCKQTPKLEFTVIEKEIARAETFDPPIKAYYFATTAETDAVVQKEIRQLSHKRVADSKFEVGVFFWEDIITELSKNQAEFALHYPQFNLTAALPQISGARKPAILDLAYYGPFVDEYMDLLFGEFSQISNANPYELHRLLLSVEIACTVLFEHTRSNPLITDTRAIWQFVDSYVIKRDAGIGGWKEISGTVKRLENSITAIENLFSGQELAIFKLGLILGRWNITTPDGYLLRKANVDRFRELFIALNPSAADIAEFDSELDKYFIDPESFSNIDTAFKIYNIVRRRLTRAAITE
jgi:hypothetical protein